MDAKAAGRGVLFLGFGGFALYQAAQYPIGAATSMGPGYFPALIATALMLAGAANLVVAFRGVVSIPLPSVTPWTVIAITAAVVSFGLLIERAGLLVALAALITLSFAASRPFRPIEALASYVVLATIGSALYVFGLGLPPSYLVWR